VEVAQVILLHEGQVYVVSVKHPRHPANGIAALPVRARVNLEVC
jgi:hypothetical protein